MDIQKEYEAFEAHAQKIYLKGPIFEMSDGKYIFNEIRNMWDCWQAGKAQAVPEGFVLVPTEKIKYFSNDGENYEVHNTLVEAKHEAKCAIQHYEDMLADQQLDPFCDGNFSQIAYGIVLAESGYSIDHRDFSLPGIVTVCQTFDSIKNSSFIA